MSRLKWVEYENVDSHILWLSVDTFNLPAAAPYNADPYKIGVRLLYTDYRDKEWAKLGKYYASVHIVSPAFSRRSSANFESMLRGMSRTVAEFDAAPFDSQCAFLIDAGMNGEIPDSQSQGTNLKLLVATAKMFATQVPDNVATFLKDGVNKIGATVGHWMQGIFDPKREAS